MGTAEEHVKCPECSTKMWRKRPPFTYGRSKIFSCTNCGVELQFTTQSQSRLIYVVLAVCLFGLVAFLVSWLFGHLAGAVLAFIGAGFSLGMLVWQGQVPQIEVVK
jgi:hypothetical protein